MMTRIRRAEECDFPGILDILNQAILNTASNFNVDPQTLDGLTTSWRETRERYPWFVADGDAGIVGYASACNHKARAAYDWTPEVSVYVHPDQQGMGFGRLLYARLIPTLRDQGFHTLVAVIALPNPASEKLHASFGFQHVGTLSQAGWKLGRWHDVGYWQLLLTDSADEPRPLKMVTEVSAV